MKLLNFVITASEADIRIEYIFFFSIYIILFFFVIVNGRMYIRKPEKKAECESLIDAIQVNK